MSSTLLSETEQKIYSRQMMIPGWGITVQERLNSAEVFIAGAGGLGSPASIYLAVAGVGHIRIADFDAPEWTNLNRQILHDPSRLGMNKALSAKQTLERLNPNVRVTAFPVKITKESVDSLVGQAALILDCMDNFETRYLLNECAIQKGIPLIHGSIRGMDGRVAVFHSPKTACLRCVFRESPPKEVFPVVGAVPGVIGTMQALEAIKILTGFGRSLKGRLLVWDGELAEFQNLALHRDPDCPACNGVSAQKSQTV